MRPREPDDWRDAIACATDVLFLAALRFPVLLFFGVSVLWWAAGASLACRTPNE